MAVFLVEKIKDYNDINKLKDFVASLFSALNKNRLTGKRVLVKPNFLKPSLPEKAIITHPKLLEAIFELLKDSGATIFLGDSPGFGSLESVVKKAELYPIINRYGVILADFSKTVKVKPKGALIFKEFDLPAILFDCDEIINVPKLKTHQMMVMTLAVKNLYGCVYGTKKIKFHLTAGENYEIFATLLIDLYLAIKPSINILDGILGMEGEGPSSGMVRAFNLVAGSDDALALDYEIVRILGLKPEKIPILKVALKNNLVPEIERLGPAFAMDDKRAIKLPKSQATNFSLPKFLNRFAKRFFFSYPEIMQNCKGCSVCLKHCPVSAIRMKNGKAEVDRARCIRCFCCQELCEHQAVRVR